FWVVAPGAENIRKEILLPLEEVEQFLDFNLGNRYMVATFHPVTTQPGEEERQTTAFLNALSTKIKEGWKVLFTLPNSDTGGRRVAELIKEWAAKNKDSVKAVASLGRRRYYSVLAHSSAAVGNSSSGLIEAPSFGIPTLNVGDRQKGRAQGVSVVNCDATESSIIAGLDKVLSPEMKEIASTAPNPYEKSGTVENIADKLLHYPLNKQKTFYEP
ncbi:MAG: UDP-N-acetyl glucosamine 2-epimerase, partial [Muribaculaceae bacterium]|nr:UDP-N-acetyl glucosamine 2-epimerase [Muribaculaceae bacterium]